MNERTVLEVTDRIGKTRPELAALVLVVAMFVGATVYMVSCGVAAIDRNTAAIAELTRMVDRVR